MKNKGADDKKLWLGTWYKRIFCKFAKFLEIWNDNTRFWNILCGGMSDYGMLVVVLCHGALFPHVSSFRWTRGIFLSCTEADNVCLCMFRYARSMTFPHGQSRRVAFRTGLSRPVPSRSRRYFLPPFFLLWEETSFAGVLHCRYHAFSADSGIVGFCVDWGRFAISSPWNIDAFHWCVFLTYNVWVVSRHVAALPPDKETSQRGIFKRRWFSCAFCRFCGVSSVGLYHCRMDTFRFRQSCLQHAAPGLRCCHACCDSD